MKPYNAEKRYKEIYESSWEDWIAQPYEEVLSFSGSWDLPEETAVVVRVFNIKKNKVKEKAFATKDKAAAYIHKRMHNPNYEVTFFDDEQLHFI